MNRTEVDERRIEKVDGKLKYVLPKPKLKKPQPLVKRLFKRWVKDDRNDPLAALIAEGKSLMAECGSGKPALKKSRSKK